MILFDYGNLDVKPGSSFTHIKMLVSIVGFFSDRSVLLSLFLLI